MLKSPLACRAAELVCVLRGRRPLVHCITNYVAANDSANLLLAAGASPIMADCSKEAEEIARKADSVLLNFGIPNPDKLLAMKLAGKAANSMGKPVVLDPVGAGVSVFRKEALSALLGEVQVQVIRANAGEMQVLAGEESVSHGVDSADSDDVRAAQTVALKYGCVAVMSGETDCITDGTNTVFLQNGHPMLAGLTGTGCMTSALTAAFSGVTKDFFAAAVAATVYMGICGEIGAKYSRGVGSFRTALLDAAGTLTKERILWGLKVK